MDTRFWTMRQFNVGKILFFFLERMFYLWKKINRKRWYRRYLTYFAKKVVLDSLLSFYFDFSKTWYLSLRTSDRATLYICCSFCLSHLHIRFFNAEKQTSSLKIFFLLSSTYALYYCLLNNPSLFESRDKLFETFLQIIHKFISE